MTREEQVAIVKELREMTGVGMMDCKKALEQTKWNTEEAINYLKNDICKQAFSCRLF